MEDVKEFFSGLFSTSPWPPRWKCGYWSDFHGWLYIISELMVWTAYFLIPLIILNYVSKKQTGIKFKKVYFLFASFILLCGSTHFIDALMFWVPMYRFNAFIRLVTGVVSLLTVYHLVKILPDAFKQRTSVELEAEIARREMAERKLSEANKNLEAFAYIASHDLQEPLRKINTFSSMLFERNEAHFDEKSKEQAAKIKQSVHRMNTMIQDVLSLSTIDDNTKLEVVNPTVAVQNALEDLELTIQDKNAVIHLQPLPPVMGNEPYLAQLFLNLISNAMKFSRNQPVINISGKQVADKVQIQVSDNGIGMEPADVDRIFLAFQRLHSKKEFEGSGIGLAICKKIIDVHKGNILVQSSPGNGTTFTIELPAATS